MQHIPALIAAKYSRRIACDTDHENATAIFFALRQIPIGVITQNIISEMKPFPESFEQANHGG